MDLFNILRGKKMMLIDDDAWIRHSLSLFFESERCNLVVLENAEQGLEALKKQAYDIILADDQLPGMDGLAFLKRAKNRHPETIEVLITAYGNHNARRAAKKRGIEGFIEKPFTTKILETCLGELLARRPLQET